MQAYLTLVNYMLKMVKKVNFVKSLVFFKQKEKERNELDQRLVFMCSMGEATSSGLKVNSLHSVPIYISRGRGCEQILNGFRKCLDSTQDLVRN